MASITVLLTRLPDLSPGGTATIEACRASNHHLSDQTVRVITAFMVQGLGCWTSWLNANPEAYRILQIWLEIESVACFVVSLGLPGSLEAVRVAAFSDVERCEGRADGWGFSEHAVHRCSLSA